MPELPTRIKMPRMTKKRKLAKRPGMSKTKTRPTNPDLQRKVKEPRMLKLSKIRRKLRMP